MLKLESVCFKVKGGKNILNDVSLSVPDGDFVVITGPNGSGKSTLAQIIMGILTPTSGRISLKNKDITKLSVTERTKLGISFSFQQPVKFKGLTVFDLLSIAGEEKVDEKKAGEYLKKVGLEPSEYLDREVTAALSGGELKRIEIATVLARNSDILIFDEPEAGIDLWSFEDLTKIFKKLHAEKKTIIVISHQERILKIADKIIILKDGKIAKAGKRDKILPEILEKSHEF